MSTDLYISEIDDDVYGSICVQMRIDGHLRLIVLDPEKRELVATFSLPPSQEGLKEALKIATALQEWVSRNENLSSNI